MTTPLLLDDLKRDEGCTLSAIPDPLSPLAEACRKIDLNPIHFRLIKNWQIIRAEPWTIGYGETGVGIGPDTVWTQAQADEALLAQVAEVELSLDKAIPWWRHLCDARQDALANMAFNLGVEGLLGFHDTLSCLKSGAWSAASKDVLASKWADEVGERAERIAHVFATGQRP